MSVRITQSMMTRTLLSDLGTVTDQLAKTQQRLESGKQLTQPSDDPFAASKALQLRAQLAANQQYQRNASEASSWQDVADTALSSINDSVARIKALVVQGATDTSTSDRGPIVGEITQLIDSIKTDANTQYAGRYVFSGSATLSQPYQLGANDTYGGNTEIMQRQIGPGVNVPLNQAGSSVIGDSSSGLLSTLRTILSDLQSGNTAALGTTDLSALDAARDNVINSQAVVGAMSNRLTTATSRLQQLEQATTQQLSDTEDADTAKTLVDYSTQQAVYQAALRSGAQMIQPSLMDFLH
ncbi:MAG: flagellar hook-associated protein FlgL [Gaiellales bacterium]